MNKTTLYLPDDLRSAVKRAALIEGVSEAEVIRGAIRRAVCDVRPRPRAGVIVGREPIARRSEDLLKGFGER